MKTVIENEEFDSILVASDWRYSAAIVGLCKYFDYFARSEGKRLYVLDKDDDGNECLYYHSDKIKKESYLTYVEARYVKDMYHRRIEEILFYDDISEEQVKLVNECITGNTVMKKCFGKLRFDGMNQEEVLKVIKKNRDEIICETYRFKNNLYRNYCNTNQLFHEEQNCCRLLGYYVDIGKKGRSMAYNFDTSTFSNQDIQEFDFIPFAFSGGRETFFINDNSNLELLIKTNALLESKVTEQYEENTLKKLDARYLFFMLLKEASEFIDFDTEVIIKKQHLDFFETIYLRKEPIQIFKKVENYKVFCTSYKVTDKYYINVLEKVTEGILNQILLDDIIELYLKEQGGGYIVSSLIKVNLYIRGGDKMTGAMYNAKSCAERVAKKMKENKQKNKIDSYRNKLISAIVFKDYNRVCEILLQLSNYADVGFEFVYDLFEDFDENKEVAYTFINALRSNENENKKREGEN